MKRLSGRLPTPATCIALVALFVSLGGTTWAVTALPRNSVGTVQLRDRSVTETELGNAAVITKKLATGTVTAPKIALGGITGDRIALDTVQGKQILETSLGRVPTAELAERAKVADRATTADSVGRAERATTAESADRADRAVVAQSATRADRADVADNAKSATALDAVDYNTETISVPEGGADFAVMTCDAGQVPVGGGFVQTGDSSDIPFIASSGPFLGQTNKGWAVEVYDIGPDTGQPLTGPAYAICVKAGGTT